MELDKRIKTITDILTVVNSDLKGIIGQTGYFGNSIMDFKRLDTCEYGELTGIIRNTDRCFEYENCAESGRQGYCYFIPEYYLNPVEPEKKYRPYSLEEFLNIFHVGDLIHFRRKNDDEVKVAMFTGYITDVDRIDDKTPGAVELMLGNFHYSLFSLFDEGFEVFFENKWQPFGVIDEGKE